MSPATVAWYIAIGGSTLLYFLSLSLIFPYMRANRHMRNRWGNYGKDSLKNWGDNFSKIDVGRLQSIRVESKLKAIFAHPYPSFKQIESLFYRSGALSHIGSHGISQVISTLVATGAIFILASLPLILSFLLGLLATAFLHFLLLKYKEKRWKKGFLAFFPAALDIINRGLKSGLTLGRGIALVSEEIDDPVGSEFNYMASQLQLGIKPESVLTEAATRIGVEEFHFFSLALIIQGEMGGSLADILGKLSEVIRERDRFRKKVWTLSSESRATAVIVGSLPIIVGIAVELINPGYIKFFFVDPRGRIMLWVSIGLTVTGMLCIIRLMSIGK